MYFITVLRLQRVIAMTSVTVKSQSSGRLRQADISFSAVAMIGRYSPTKSVQLVVSRDWAAFAIVAKIVAFDIPAVSRLELRAGQILVAMDQAVLERLKQLVVFW